MNQAAGRYAYPRIIPGIIEAKFYTPQFQGANSAPAQAYLWLGGELVTAGAQNAIGLAGNDAAGAYHVIGHKNGPNAFVALGAEAAGNFPIATTPGTGAKIASYAFTSEYLFGQFNSKAGAAARFADCWMNGAGFGQSGAWDGGECCGWATSSAGMSVNNLQGNLKGGLFLCSLNGEQRMHQVLPFGDAAAPAGQAQSRFDRQLWSDWDDSTTLGGAFVAPAALSNWVDLWADGPVELGTTDCASGTFSLRRVTRDMTQDLAAPADTPLLTAAALAAWGGAGVVPTFNRAAGTTADGTLELLRTIKGCMLSLNRNAVMAGTDAAAAPNNAAVPTALFGPTFYNAYLAQ
jgi:hypothetical protein